MQSGSDSRDGAAPRHHAAPAQQLIRAEVIEARGAQWLGTIRMAQPVSNWLIVAVALLITCALLAFISIGSITRKARVGGIIVPAGGSLSILASNGGVLSDSFVTEGQFVEAGKPLFQLSTERQGQHGELTALVGQQLAARRHSLEAERRARLRQSEEQRHALALRRANLLAELGQLEQELVLARRRHALAQDTMAKFEALQGHGFMSAAQTQQQQEAVLDLAARLSAVERTKLQLRAAVQAADSERTTLANGLAADLAQLDRALALLEQEAVENLNRKTSVIVAPEDGTVTAITYQPGQAILGGQVLGTLVPKAKKTGGEIEAHLYAPSRAIGFVAKGQRVLVRLQAFPYQKYGMQEGIVADISATPFAPGELPANIASTILGTAAQASPEGLYRVKVRLLKHTILAQGRQQALRPGMTLEADVVQDHVKIWEWIVEPLLAVARRSGN